VSVLATSRQAAAPAEDRCIMIMIDAALGRKLKGLFGVF
jgi:hypothetical protein